jgi:hypothetical protein
MHEEAHLLHSIWQIRPCQNKVLEGTINSLVLCRIFDRGSLYSKQLSTSVHGCCSGVTLSHVGVLKEVKSVLLLG